MSDEEIVLQEPELEDDPTEPADPTPLTLGEMLDKAFELKNQIGDYEDLVNGYKKELELLQYQIANQMENKDLNKIECAAGSAKVKKEPYPNIKDWEAFTKWMSENNRFEFIEKRVARKATRDYLENEGLLPNGVDVFIKTTLELRKKAKRRK